MVVATLHLRVVVTIVLLLLFRPFPLIDAAADHAIALYRSEQYDYFFFYDAFTWDIQDQFTEPGSEFVSFTAGPPFTDAQIEVSYRAFDNPDMTPRECIESILKQYAKNPAIVTVESLESPPGQPRIDEYAYGVEVRAWVELIITLKAGDPRVKLATLEECEQLAPGKSLFNISTNIPARLYNLGVTFYGPEVTPWMKGYRPRDEAFDYSRPVDLVDANGDLVGTLAANPQCVNSDRFYGVARNLAPSNSLILDPLGLTAVTDSDKQVEQVDVDWLYPPDPEFVLQPDAVGLFQLTVRSHHAGRFGLWYSPGEGSPVFLGVGGEGCAGGGGAPVLIDLE